MKASILSAAATLILAATSVGNVSAKGSLRIHGCEYTVDTISHVKVGPGTTTTHLQLVNLTADTMLQVFYSTIDRKAAPVTIRAVKGGDKITGRERPSAMAKRKSVDGRLYFVGTNADFYATSGALTQNGVNKNGTPHGSCTVDGYVYKTSTSYTQFIATEDDEIIVDNINYYTGTATIGSKVTYFKGINVTPPANGITIFTPKYFGATDTSNGTYSLAEVTAKLVGGSFEAGQKFQLQVTSTSPNTTGNTTIPDDGFVIFGRGTSTTGSEINTGALSFVKNLKEGDIVEFQHVCRRRTDDSVFIPKNIISGNPKIVGDGLTLTTEADRTDASALHPRTSIGRSLTGDSVIMMVVDGRTTISAGVRTTALADIMRYAKAWEAINVDGGGSSTLYTSALGIQNHCSDGSERAVTNGIFATVDCPTTDNNVSEIWFTDFKKELNPGDTYTPTFYGYNSYGVMVSTNLQGVKLSGPSAMGAISSDGKTLTANTPGTYELTATYGNKYQANIIVTVLGETGIESPIADSSLKGHISVSDGIITVYDLPDATAWSIYSSTGSLIASDAISATPTTIDATTLPSGIYIVAVDTPNGRLSSKVII